MMAAEPEKRVLGNIRMFISAIFPDQSLVTDTFDQWSVHIPSISIESFVPALASLVSQLTQIQSELEEVKCEPEMVSSPTPTAANTPTATTTTTINNGPRRKACLNNNLIQITANKSEIDRRIAAFIQQKQLDVDEENRREFCSEFFPFHVEEKEHCARTGAVFIPRSGTRSHVAVSRVENVNGPQLHIPSCKPSLSLFTRIKKEESEEEVKQEEPTAVLPLGLEERISNVATHLKIPYDSKKSEVFDMLKQLEKRVLFLESLSPEYFMFQDEAVTDRRRRHYGSSFKMDNPTTSQELTLWEINSQMRCLRESLKRKRLKVA
ncbi:MAP3K12-binding inhibitory protein 1-like [Argonauta hians]